MCWFGKFGGHFIKTFHWNKLIATRTILKTVQFHSLLGMKDLRDRGNKGGYNRNSYNCGAHPQLSGEE